MGTVILRWDFSVSISSESSINKRLISYSYVAMHSMIETTSFPDGHMHEQTANGYIESHRGKPSPSKSDIATALVGMLIPLLTQVGH